MRAGTLLITSPDSDGFEHDATAALELQPFQLQEGARASAQVFAPDGQRQLRFEASREGGQLRLRLVEGAPPAKARYRLALAGGRKIPWENPERDLLVEL